MANKIKLKIGGIEYALVSDDDEISARKMGDEINRHLETVKTKNPHLSTTMVAMLTALDYCEELTKTKEEYNKLSLQLKNAVEDAACARFEGDQARREVERLTNEINALRSQNGTPSDDIKLF